jgi:hypothetical protein
MYLQENNSNDRWKIFHLLKYYDKKVENAHPEHLNFSIFSLSRSDVNFDKLRKPKPHNLLKIDHIRSEYSKLIAGMMELSNRLSENSDSSINKRR